jgi:PEGA domain
MAHRLRLLCVIAVSLLTSFTLAQAQTTSFSRPGFAGGLAFGSNHSMGAVSAFPGQASAGAYTYASSPKQEDGGQQQGNGNQGQSQGGNQNQGMNRNQNPNQTPNPNQNKQGEGKEEAPPEKPHYLTYTPKKKSLQEEAKSGKALAVEFKSVPAGAEITVDGFFLGKTPMTTQIPLGKHLVSITKWGYQSWAQEMDVANGNSLSVNPTLHKDW